MALPLRLQAPQKGVQARDLVDAERRRRLVEDDHRGVGGERLGDLDELLLGDRQAARRPRSGSIATSISARTRRAPSRIAVPVDCRPRFRRAGRDRCSRRRSGVGTRENSWKTVAMPRRARCARIGKRDRTRRVAGFRRRRADGRRDSILISVDFPQPFSPSRPWISPGMELRSDTVVHGDDAGKALGDSTKLPSGSTFAHRCGPR